MTKIKQQYEIDRLKEKSIKDGAKKQMEAKNVTMSAAVEKPKVKSVPPKNVTPAKKEQPVAKSQVSKQEQNDKSTKGAIDLDSVGEGNSPQST